MTKLHLYAGHVCCRLYVRDRSIVLQNGTKIVSHPGSHAIRQMPRPVSTLCLQMTTAAEGCSVYLRPCREARSTTNTALKRLRATLGRLPGKLGTSRSLTLLLNPRYLFLSWSSILFMSCWQCCQWTTKQSKNAQSQLWLQQVLPKGDKVLSAHKCICDPRRILAVWIDNESGGVQCEHLCLLLLVGMSHKSRA